MDNLVQRIAICPRENVSRQFKLIDRFARQYGTNYECVMCGQVVNEAYIIFEEKNRSSHKT